MAIRIGEFVCSGTLSNFRRNSICGWIDFGNELGLRLELTGNLPGDFSGRHFIFTVQEPQLRSVEFDQQIDAMEIRQAGTLGNVMLHVRKIPTCSMEEFRRRLQVG